MLNEGWRDAWLWPATSLGEAWTWSGHGHRARFDRVFVHDAQNGAKVERQAIARLSGFWPALSDHVALHAVLVRRPGTSGEERAYHDQPRPSSSGTASDPQEASVAFILGLAECARAVWDAAFLEPEACAEAAEAA